MMKRMKWPVSMLGVLAVLCGTPANGNAQASGEQVTKEAFVSLSWLSGRWRGSGGGFDGFYEEYRMPNDSTLEQRTFPDSTFTEPDGFSTFRWRGGVVLRDRNGTTGPYPMRVRGDTVRFEPMGQGRPFTWYRVSDDEWRAILERPGNDIVYVMRRLPGGR